MKQLPSRETRSTIQFQGKLAASTALVLPKKATANLKDVTTVEATINGFPFRAALESSDAGKTCSLTITAALRAAAGAEPGDTVSVEITRAGQEPETRVPPDLAEALSKVSLAKDTWENITPAARRDWILWIISAKQPETRLRRIENACDMLASGKKRVCCFGGLNWLRKDHPKAGDAWVPLPK